MISHKETVTPKERLSRAFGRIDTWLRTNDANALADDLALGASAAALDSAEASFGMPLPEGLRALWSLHNGQIDELGILGHGLPLLSIERALGRREAVTAQLAEVRAQGNLSSPELASDAWIPFAGLEGDQLWVHAPTGYVFSIEQQDEDPRPHHAFDSLDAYFEWFASALERNDYCVQLFGERGRHGELTVRPYLAQRNRGIEDWQARQLAQLMARKEALASQPIAALVAADIAANRPDECTDVVDAAIERGRITEALEVLFAHGTSDFVASALRRRFRDLELTTTQWKIVAEGGAAIGNDKIVEAARAKLGLKPSWKI